MMRRKEPISPLRLRKIHETALTCICGSAEWRADAPSAPEDSVMKFFTLLDVKTRLGAVKKK